MADVENRTFPSEVTLKAVGDSEGRRGIAAVLAITEFEEPHAEKIVIAGDGLSPSVDGVLLA